MARSPSARWLVLPVVLTAVLVALTPVQSQPPAAPPPEADATVPIAESFKTLDTTLTISGKPHPVTLNYYVQNKTVFVLPTLAVVGPVERVRGTDRVTRDTCRPDDPLVPLGEAGTVRVEMVLKDLSADETVWEAIKAKLRERITADRGKKGQEVEYEFTVPSIKENSYTVSLTADGTGDEKLPAEVPLSNEIKLPASRRVRLELDRPMIARLEKENGRPLTLADARLKVGGLMNQRFEKLQFEGSVSYLKGAVAALRKRVASSAPTGAGEPDVFVSLPGPGGGEVESANAIRTALSSSLAVTMSVREGSNTSPLLPLMEESLKSVLQQQSLSTLDDKKQVSVLVGGQVTFAATVGQIKSLAKMKTDERTAKLKTAVEDFHSRQSGSSSNYSGEVKVGFLAKMIPIGGEAKGSAVNSSSDSYEDRTRRELDTLQHGFDQLANHFAGDVPTLTGIAFDDKATTAAFEQIEQQFSKRTFTTGYAQRRWPDIKLGGTVDPSISPAVLAEQYALTRADLDRTRKLFGTADKLEKARVDLDALEKALERLTKLEADLTAKSAAAEKRVKDAVATVDATEVSRLKAELSVLKKRTQPATFSAKAVDFAAPSTDYPPPGLDCTGTAGVDAKTAEAAQAAWAAHHKVKVSPEFPIADTKVKIGFRVVPRAVYNRGSNVYDDEMPVKAITISKAFAVGETEVTQAQWKAVMGADNNPSSFKGDDLPVDSVTHTEAEEFCTKFGKLIGKPVRLPTEAEWELACRAGTTTHYSFGDTISDKEANYDATSSFNNSPKGEYRKTTVAVKTFQPNAWGLYDMHGNVWEWCSDWYDSDYYKTSPTSDPKGPDTKQTYRVLRGGSWSFNARNCRAAFRHRFGPGDRNNLLGFRVVFCLD